MSRDAAMALATGTPATPQEPQSPQTEAPALSSTPFNALAKKESEFVRQRQEFKKEQETMAAEKAKLVSIQKQIQTYEETKKTDPVAALKMLGFSEADLFNYMAANEKKEPTPEERAAEAAGLAAEARIKAFEDGQLKRVQEEQQKQDTAIIEGFKSDLSRMVKSDPLKFEYCNHHGVAAENLMYETALAVVTESKGKDVLTPLEAAQLVEEYYEEQDKLMSQLKKRQPKAPPQAEPKEPVRTRTVSSALDPALTPKPTITKTRTLTNSATSTVASTRHRMNETRDQKRDRLVEALKNGKI